MALGVCRTSTSLGVIFVLFMYTLTGYFPLQLKLMHNHVEQSAFLSIDQSGFRIQESRLASQPKPLLRYANMPVMVNKSMWKQCSWVACPAAYGINRRDKANRRLVLFVTGQLTRLELRSKIVNMIQQNSHDHEIYAVFLLKVGQSKSSNYKNRLPGPFDTSEWSNLTALTSHIAHSFPNASSIHVNRTFTRRVLTRQEFFFVMTNESGKVFLRVAFGLTQDEPMGSLLLNPAFKPRPKQAHKQLNHQDMFRNIRSAMIFLERIELSLGLHMDYLFRLREDTFVLRPFRIRKFNSRSVFWTPRCWTAGGFTDVSFMVGRNVASRILRGLAEDYYFRLSSHYINPEHYLKRLAIHYKSEVVTVSACSWPMIPVIFVGGRSGLEMRLRGNSRRTVLNACDTRGVGKCFWHEAGEIIRGSTKPYLKDKFSTWT